MGFVRVAGAVVAGLGLLLGAATMLFVCRECVISSARASWFDCISGVLAATCAVALGLWLIGGARDAWHDLRARMKESQGFLESAAWVTIAMTIGSFGLVIALALAGAPERVVWTFGSLALLGWGLSLVFVILLVLRHGVRRCAASWARSRHARRRGPG